MTFPEDAKDTEAAKNPKGVDFDNLPAKKMLETMESLIEEVLDVHCYYNSQDRKGSVGRGGSPKLKDKISAEVAAMTIPGDYSFLEGFSRKIFLFKESTRDYRQVEKLTRLLINTWLKPWNA